MNERETIEYAGPAEQGDERTAVEVDGRFTIVERGSDEQGSWTLLEDARVGDEIAVDDRELHRYRIRGELG